MVLGHSHRRHSIASNHSSNDESRGDPTTTADDETVVDSEQGNMLTHIISQLRPGADLSRVTLPTFILEPRSMLERITNFMAHPETLLPMAKIDDPVERFVAVIKFYLSGWHIKPPGVKKPLNPILGETFTCYWDYPDKTRGYYIAEQTSHHPPKSSYFFLAPEHHIRIDGTLKPRSKFLGNSAASMMEGIAIMRFLNRGGERYFVTQPNMYARGILFGKMKYELGDHSFVRCPETGLSADIEFKTKGYFGGTYDAIGGFIKNTHTGENLYELSGLWSKEMYIKDLTTGKKQLLFDATRAKETPPTTRPLEEQGERESQKLWWKVTRAIKQKDQETATDEKTRIEDMQRQEAARRADEGVDWRPALFRPVQGGPGGPDEGEEDLDWIINTKVDGKTPADQTKQVLNIAAILPGQDPHRRFSIPSRKGSLEQVPGRQQQETKSENKTEPTQPAQPAQPTQPTQPAPQASAPASHSDDLIDFGQNDGAAAAPMAHGETKQLPIRNNVHLLGDLMDTPETPKASAMQPGKGGATIVRQDSETSEVDEFVDAES